MILGFTGTRAGMTNKQYVRVHDLYCKLLPEIAVHGGCSGADKHFDELMEKMFRHHGAPVEIHVRPGYGTVTTYYDLDPHVVMSRKNYLDRNKDIVAEACVVIACPSGCVEMPRGSGTWATIRYTRTAKKPLYIVYPDGRVEEERT